MTDKERWILKTLPPEGADVLNSDFVDSFIKEFNPTFRPTAWGAYKCPALGRLLSNMCKKGILGRMIISLGANWQPGFPKWAYVYSVNEDYISYANELKK